MLNAAIADTIATSLAHKPTSRRPMKCFANRYSTSGEASEVKIYRLARIFGGKLSFIYSTV